MDTPFLGMIAIFGFNFPPRGWATCQGQLIAIQQNSALFALLGTFYGGNGQSTFALPDLRGRTLIGQGQGASLSSRTIGELSGAESVTLQTSQMPQHVHSSASTANGNATTPVNNYLALSPKIGSGPNATQLKTFVTPDVAGTPAPTAGIAGGSQPHSNMQPYLVINYSIATSGIFPSRN